MGVPIIFNGNFAKLLTRGINWSPQDTDPANPVTGSMFIASDSHATKNAGSIYLYFNSVWNEVGSVDPPSSPSSDTGYIVGGQSGDGPATYTQNGNKYVISTDTLTNKNSFLESSKGDGGYGSNNTVALSCGGLDTSGAPASSIDEITETPYADETGVLKSEVCNVARRDLSCGDTATHVVLFGGSTTSNSAGIVSSGEKIAFLNRATSSLSDTLTQAQSEMAHGQNTTSIFSIAGTDAVGAEDDCDEYDKTDDSITSNTSVLSSGVQLNTRNAYSTSKVFLIGGQGPLSSITSVIMSSNTEQSVTDTLNTALLAAACINSDTDTAICGGYGTGFLNDISILNHTIPETVTDKTTNIQTATIRQFAHQQR